MAKVLDFGHASPAFLMRNNASPSWQFVMISIFRTPADACAESAASAESDIGVAAARPARATDMSAARAYFWERFIIISPLFSAAASGFLVRPDRPRRQPFLDAEPLG